MLRIKSTVTHTPPTPTPPLAQGAWGPNYQNPCLWDVLFFRDPPCWHLRKDSTLQQKCFLFCFSTKHRGYKSQGIGWLFGFGIIYCLWPWIPGIVKHAFVCTWLKPLCLKTDSMSSERLRRALERSTSGLQVKLGNRHYSLLSVF